MEEMNAAVNAVMTPAVRIWVNWMLAIFLVSIFFVWKHKSARIILAAFILTLPVALVIFELGKNPHLLGISHILVWTPLAVYLLKTEISGQLSRLKSPYGIYLVLLLITIAISLVFDVRDVILVTMGLK
ncbi:MAG: hypothetical protein R3318_06540 [Gammaproteobacteria bacterium]|nr:hypothetical protein [Gammaproteobacteria bacterium]